MGDVITSFLNRQCSQKTYHDSEGGSQGQLCTLLNMTGHYFRELNRLGLWSISRLPLGSNLIAITELICRIVPY